jgi:hypothetical protein
MQGKQIRCTLSAPGWPDFVLRADDGIRLQPSIASIAKHFNAKKAQLLVTTDTNEELQDVDGNYVVPVSFRDRLSNNFAASVEGEDTGNGGTATSSDEEETEKVVYADHKMQERYVFLLYGTIPTRFSVTREARKNFKNRVRRGYTLDEEYKLIEIRGVNKDYVDAIKHIYVPGTTREVIARDADALSLIQKIHGVDHNHDRTKNLEAIIRAKYKISLLREKVVHVLQNCVVCNEFRHSTRKMVSAILTSRPLEIVMWDLFTFYVPSPDGFVYFLCVQDHFTKYRWGREFKTKDMEPIADFIYMTFKDLGCPEQFMADNGSEFNNQVLSQILYLFGNPPYTHGKPRNPQTTGLIENCVKDVKHKLMLKCRDKGLANGDTVFDWVPLVAPLYVDLNDRPITLYGGVLTPFMCLNNVPRASPFLAKITGEELETMHATMYQKQVN